MSKISGGVPVSLNKKRRKKPKEGTKKFKGTGLRIVDDEDAFGFGRAAGDSSDDEQAEELPQIAAVVDERPREVQMAEEFQKGKWKTLGNEGSGGFKAVGASTSRNDSDSDGSNSNSPPRNRQRHDSDADLSPPRGRRQRHDSDDLSPPRQRHDSDADLSPPRARRQRHDSDEDLSPPRKRRNNCDDDLSPPRSSRSRRRDSDGDLSPPRPKSTRDRRQKKSSDSDLSPPRNSGYSSRPHGRFNDRNNSNSKRSIERPEIIEDDKKLIPGTTLEGKRAGLQRAKDLRKEMIDYKKKENEMFENLDDEVSGRYARTKIRDKATGKERDLGAELAKKEEQDRVEAEKKKLYDKWGKGLKQVEAQQTKRDEALHEVSKPLARYSDDRDLDEYLRNQVRDGDPMLKFLTTKKKAFGGGGSDKPMYSGPPPMPNRFAILPGYRWDGVDRSNGYEKEWFSRINDKKAFQEEAYKWSVEDL